MLRTACRLRSSLLRDADREPRGVKLRNQTCQFKGTTTICELLSGRRLDRLFTFPKRPEAPNCTWPAPTVKTMNPVPAPLLLPRTPSSAVRFCESLSLTFSVKRQSIEALIAGLHSLPPGNPGASCSRPARSCILVRTA